MINYLKIGGEKLRAGAVGKKFLWRNCNLGQWRACEIAKAICYVKIEVSLNYWVQGEWVLGMCWFLGIGLGVGYLDNKGAISNAANVNGAKY